METELTGYVIPPQARLKRTAKPSGEDRAGSPIPAEDTSLFTEPLGRRKRKQGRRRGQGMRQGSEEKKTKKTFREFVRRSSFPSLPVLKMVQQIEVCVYLSACVSVKLMMCCSVIYFCCYYSLEIQV